MARRKPVTAIAAQYTPTIIEFLLDETGSMGSCKNSTVAGFNDFLTEQQAQSGSCLLSLTKFDTGGQKTPYVDIDVRMVPGMIDDWFIPGGGTNLRDTIGARLASLKQRLETWSVKPNVLFVVMTDGDDNASREFSEPVIKAALKSYMQEGWTFVYLGADQDALEVANRLGFPDGNIKSFASSKMRETMQGLAKATTAYRATRSATKAADADTDFFNAAR
jgi:hypothetical protein